MCTLMQKDVLIELIATTQADLSKRLTLPLNTDQQYLSRLRGEIYRTDPNAINFEQLVEQVHSIGQKYRSLPLL